MLRRVGLGGIAHLPIKPRKRILQLGSLDIVPRPADIILQTLDRPEVSLQREKLHQRDRNALGIGDASPRQLFPPPIRGLFILLLLTSVFDQNADHEIKFAVIVCRIGEFKLGALPQIVQSGRQIGRKLRVSAQRQHHRIVRRRPDGSETVQISHLPQATDDRPPHRRAGFFVDQSAQRVQTRTIVKLGQRADRLPPQFDFRRSVTQQQLLYRRLIARYIPRQIQENFRRLLPQPRILRSA